MSKLFSKAASTLSRNDGAGGEEEGESLTTVLRTHEQRSALTILIADCTEAMRQILVDAFDAKETTGGTSNSAADNLGSEDGSNGNDVAPTDPEQVAKQQQKEKELVQRQKELNEADMQTLKAAALKHFDDWRTAVIGRVGEVVNSRETAEKHSKQAKPKEQHKDIQGTQETPKTLDLPEYDERHQSVMEDLYPPMENPLRNLPEDQRALIIHSLLLLLLSLENYQAQSRILLLRLSTSLHLPVAFLANDENKVAHVLLTAAESMSADNETKQAAEQNKSGRKWKVGLATVAGAALIGITGGLAAPLLAAGIGTVMGGLGLGATAAAGYLGALASSGVLVGSLFGAYGGRMTGKMMDQYAREVEDFAFVPVRSPYQHQKTGSEQHRLRVAVGVTGWLTSQDEVVDPWNVLGDQLESFALRWELESLMRLGNAITTMVTSAAWSYARMEILKRTVFGALYAGLWPLGLLKLSRVIDNPFAVANYRAQKAGEVLADALMNKAQGQRPVTLVGYSLGGKVIFTCLRKLAEQQAFGLIESVVLIGTPAPSTAPDWRMIRSVVAGRVINVYSTKDYILGFLYRSHSVQYGVAGLQAIDHVSGVESFDVSELVSGHTAYRHLTGTILKQVGFEDINSEALLEEEEAFQMQEAKEEMERERSEEESKATADDIPEDYVNDLEKEVEKKNERTYIAWTQEKMVAAGTSASAALEKAKAQYKWRSKEPVSEADTSSSGDIRLQSQEDKPPTLPQRPKN